MDQDITGDPPHLLIAEDGSYYLQGGHNEASGKYVFPLMGGDKEFFQPVPLKREGTVWSFTVQRFRPKTPPYAGPDDFTPYLVAYVDLPGQLKVEARLVDIEEDDVEIGLPVELTVVPDINGAPGSVMHAFRPMAKGAT